MQKLNTRQNEACFASSLTIPVSQVLLKAAEQFNSELLKWWGVKNTAYHTFFYLVGILSLQMKIQYSFQSYGIYTALSLEFLLLEPLEVFV